MQAASQGHFQESTQVHSAPKTSHSFHLEQDLSFSILPPLDPMVVSPWPQGHAWEWRFPDAEERRRLGGIKEMFKDMPKATWFCEGRGDKGQTDHHADLKSEDSPSTDRRCDHSGLRILPERGGVAQGGP